MNSYTVALDIVLAVVILVVDILNVLYLGIQIKTV